MAEESWAVKNSYRHLIPAQHTFGGGLDRGQDTPGGQASRTMCLRSLDDGYTGKKQRRGTARGHRDQALLRPHWPVCLSTSLERPSKGGWVALWRSQFVRPIDHQPPLPPKPNQPSSAFELLFPSSARRSRYTHALARHYRSIWLAVATRTLPRVRRPYLIDWAWLTLRGAYIKKTETPSPPPSPNP